MQPKLKVVFDTNIYISALLFGGNPRQCLELAKAGEVELLSSRAIYLELADKLQNKFLWEIDDIKELVIGLSKISMIVSPGIKIDKIKGDPRDNRILECALHAKADYIVTGDKKHLLSLKKFRKIPIISAREFMEITND